MKIVVREGRIGDALDLCRLRRRVWLSCYVCAERGLTEERILAEYRFTDAESVFSMRTMLAGGAGGEVGVFVAEARLKGGSKGGRKVMGFVAGERQENSLENRLENSLGNRLEHRLTMLYVDSVCQGRGIGGMLWERMRGFLDGGSDGGDIVLTVVDFNEGAQAFYRRRGFVFDEGVGVQEGCESLFGSRGMRLRAVDSQ